MTHQETDKIIKAYYFKSIQEIYYLGKQLICIVFSKDNLTFVDKSEVDQMADTMLWHEHYRNLHKLKMITYEKS